MAFSCFMSSAVVLPITLKPSSFSPSNNRYVLKSATRTNISCDLNSTSGLLEQANLPSIPQNGQKGYSKPVPRFIGPDDLHRSNFPPNFIFGAGTSAIQIEGDGTEGGRGPSTGDYTIHANEGGKGVDSYHKFKEDVAMLKEMGIPYYRFSISWSRLLPDGTPNSLNSEGIKYYKDLLDELEKNGIQPFVTLFHFDMPTALQTRYNGFMDRKIIGDFLNYCSICFDLFGHRVKRWITINEGATFILFTDMCLTQDQRKDPLNQFIAAHHIILCHAAVAKLYREKYKKVQGGELGMAIVSKWFEPKSTAATDQHAADISFDFLVGWFMHPFKYGEYPKTLQEWVRGLPEFSDAEKKEVIDSCDFFGINYYTASYTTGFPSGQMLIKDGVTDLKFLIKEEAERDKLLIGPEADGVYKINIYPKGLKKVILQVKNKYGNQKMYVTENGCSSYPNITMSHPDALGSDEHIDHLREIEKELNDEQRLEYFQSHLHHVLQAMREGANVQGYIFWSLLDNCEFGNYDVRFGLCYVDYHNNYKRQVKKSGKWYADFLSGKPIVSGSGASASAIAANS